MERLDYVEVLSDTSESSRTYMYKQECVHVQYMYVHGTILTWLRNKMQSLRQCRKEGRPESETGYSWERCCHTRNQIEQQQTNNTTNNNKKVNKPQLIINKSKQSSELQHTKFTIHKKTDNVKNAIS